MATLFRSNLSFGTVLRVIFMLLMQVLRFGSHLFCSLQQMSRRALGPHFRAAIVVLEPLHSYEENLSHLNFRDNLLFSSEKLQPV
jgi:hypothetical protein